MGSTKNENEGLTLGQLKEKIDKLIADGISADTAVITEGCDCTGVAGDVVVHATYVEITRIN